VYYKPFAAAIEAGVASFMCAYNLVNGTHACGNSDLLSRDLKGRLNFEGFVMSDWWAVHDAGYEDAGLDMDMPGERKSERERERERKRRAINPPSVSSPAAPLSSPAAPLSSPAFPPLLTRCAPQLSPPSPPNLDLLRAQARTRTSPRTTSPPRTTVAWTTW
jgi:beta-glucosidase